MSYVTAPVYATPKSTAPITLPDPNKNLSYGVPPSKPHKKARDPTKPRKPRSAYILFSMEIRALVKAELGDTASFEDIAFRMGNLWVKLKERPDSYEYRKYLQLAESDKDRYMAEMKIYCK